MKNTFAKTKAEQFKQPFIFFYWRGKAKKLKKLLN